MSSSNSRSYNQSQPWQHQIEKYQERIIRCNQLASQHAYSLSPAYNEETFRDQFEALCRQQGEVQYARLQGRLEFRFINAFANAIDSVEGHSSTGSLAALVFGGTLVAVQAASLIEVSPANVVALLGKLNGKVPRVAAKVHSCAQNPKLQKILHEIFEQYMGALLLVIEAYSNAARTRTQNDPSHLLHTDIEATTRELNRQNDLFQREYDQSLAKATKFSGHGTSLSSRSVESHHDISTVPLSSQYQEGRVLGHGSRGVVVQWVKKVSTRREFARKRIQLCGSDDENAALVESIEREIENMEKLRHKHVVQIFESDRRPAPSPDQPGLRGVYDIFIRPIADQTLKEYLDNCSTENYPTQSLDRIVPWFGCLLDALRHAHDNGIAHMDIKPSNILIQGDQVYLADFGISKDISRNADGHTLGDEGFGTPAYRAPELVSGTSRDFPADIFSLGCVFSEMLTVCAKYSLDEYASNRNSPGARSKGAFRDNLEHVRAWLQSLANRTPRPVFRMVFYLVATMMEPNPLDRQNSAQLWLMIKPNTSLWCGNHE